MHIVLETERMLLRRLTAADAGPLAALYGDPRVIRFITLQPPSLTEVESKILPAYLREYQELADGLGSFAGIEKKTGQMAGRFSLKLQQLQLRLIMSRADVLDIPDPWRHRRRPHPPADRTPGNSAAWISAQAPLS